jgi:predicted nucleic acid-binding protein
MKIADALKAVKRLYIETAPLIYYVEENPTYVDKMDAIIATVMGGSIEAVSSVLTLTEILIHPLKQDNTQLEQEYRTILLHSRAYRLLPITAQVAISAAGLRARYNLRTPDALLVQLLGFSIQITHPFHLSIEPVGVFGPVIIQPVAAQMWFQSRLVLKNAPPAGGKCAPRCRAGWLHPPLPPASNGSPVALTGPGLRRLSPRSGPPAPL